MEGKGKVRTALGSLFKRNDADPNSSTDEIVQALSVELAKLDLLRAQSGLNDQQDRKYARIQKALKSLRGDEAAAKSDATGGSGGFERSWRKALADCEEALVLCLEIYSRAHSAGVLRCSQVLRIQRDDLEDLCYLLDGQDISALDVLSKLYIRTQHALTRLGKEVVVDEKRIVSLMTMLNEGPDYLLTLSLLKAIETLARQVDGPLGDAVRVTRRKVTKSKAVTVTMLAAVGDIRQVAAEVTTETLCDPARAAAYKRLDEALDRLQARLEPAEIIRAPTPVAQTAIADMPSAGLAVATQSASSPSAESISVPFPRRPQPGAATSSYMPAPSERIPESRADNGTQQTYRSSPTASEARPSSAVSSVSKPTGSAPAKTVSAPSLAPTAEPELYEYGGHILTRSALSLVMLQERMEHADSSGQYAGEVQWDPVRQTWIPVYIKNLRKSDVGPGEQPDRNPANFEVKEEDEFGNRIGWSGDQMYYVDDPVFEIRRDD